MDNIFESLSGAPVVAVAEASPIDEEARKKVIAMKNAMTETLQTDPTYASRVHAWSDSLEVINSLGFRDQGGVVVDKEKSTKDQRSLTNTSGIVGYRIHNIGTTPIPYTTEEWTLGEDGKYVGEKVEKTLAPDGVADLSRLYMTRTCAQAEISFQLANGKVISGSGSKSARGDIKAEMAAYYFSFEKGLGLQVNSDEVKLNVSEKDESGKWQVKPEFVSTFGFLMNIPEKRKDSRKRTDKRYSSTDIAANYVMSMIKDSTI